MSRQVTDWIFTGYDHDAPYTLWKHASDLPQRLRYLAWQDEICPTTDRGHQQGFAVFTRSVRRSTVSTLLGCCGLHLEPRYGSGAQARDYALKDETRSPGGRRVEIGELPASNQGCRTDLADFAEAIKRGDKMSKVATEFDVTFVRYHKGALALRFTTSLARIPHFRRLKTLVLYGVTGIGKTRVAVGLSDPDDYFILDSPDGANLWFDGYDGESTLIIDDFYGWIKWGFFLRLLDGYRVRLPIKGTHAYAAFERIIITSNKPPGEWYPSKGRPPELSRRLTKVVHMIDPLDFTEPLLPQLFFSFE